MRSLLVGSIALLVMSMAPRWAAACNPTADEFGHLGCSKGQPREPRVRAASYVRAAPARLPRHASRARLVALLAHARWDPLPEPGAGVIQPIRLVDGADVPAAIARWPGVRNVIARDVVADDGTYQLVFEGTLFTLQPCRDRRRRLTTCLVPAN